MFTTEQLEAYHRDGYVVARDVFNPADVELLLSEVEQSWQSCDCGELAQNTSYAGVKKMSTIRDPQLHSAVFTRYLTDPRLTEHMGQIVGANVQLHHSKINIKTTQDKAIFPLHQDHPYFPHANHTLCTVLVHLTDTSSRRGCFRAMPGVKQPLEHIHDDGHILDPQKYPLEEAQELPAAAGDVVFMNYLTPHGSNLNEEEEPRVLWIIQIRAAEDRPIQQPAGTQQATPPGNRPGQGTMLLGANPDFEYASAGASSKL